MKKVKLLLTTMIIAAFFTMFPLLTSTSAATIKLNKSYITAYPKQKIQLKVSGTSKKVKWTTNKKDIVNVSKSGKITALKIGNATITAKVGKKKYRCKITVLTKKKIYNKLDKIYNYLCEFNSESTDLDSTSSVKNSLRTIKKMTQKYTTFVNSLCGNKYLKYKSAYNEVIVQLNNIHDALSEWLIYSNSDSSEYYDSAIEDLWDAKLDMYGELLLLY